MYCFVTLFDSYRKVLFLVVSWRLVIGPSVRVLR